MRIRKKTGIGKQRGSALPIILAMTIGVGALTTGYTMRNMRASDRHGFDKARTEALYRAWAQMELVTYMVNTADYATDGSNAALSGALARTDNQFIGPDGWQTGVFAAAIGASGDGMYEIVSRASVEGQTREVTSLMRERQSFADFNVFVASQSVGISGGQISTFPYPDAPEGSIHSNDMLQFYFPDRHFRDPLSAVNGFEYAAGAVGPNDPNGDTQNTHFHGPIKDDSEPITGLTDVVTSEFATGGAEGADTILSLDHYRDYAYVKFQGDTVHVHHYRNSYYEDQEVTYQQDYGHWESEILQAQNYVQQTVTVSVPTDHYDPVPYTYWVTEQQAVFVEGGGGGESGGSGGSGATGYYIYVDVQVEYTGTNWVYSHTTWADQDQTSWVWDGTYYDYTNWYWVVDGYNTVTETQSVYIPWQDMGTHEVNADGVIYVAGDIYIDRMRTSSGDQYDVHRLEGSVTLVSSDDIRIRDSIQYQHTPVNGNGYGTVQTAYLNGLDYTQDYVPNPDYGGASVLGLIANDEISYETSYMDQNVEINATMLAVQDNIYAYGIRVDSNGNAYTSGSAYVRDSMRRLGGLISNRRPVSSYVDSNNAVVRGFIRGKTIFDKRQLVNPPRGFPTLNRPRILATIVKEVR